MEELTFIEERIIKCICKFSEDYGAFFRISDIHVDLLKDIDGFYYAMVVLKYYIMSSFKEGHSITKSEMFEVQGKDMASAVKHYGNRQSYFKVLKARVLGEGVRFEELCYEGLKIRKNVWMNDSLTPFISTPVDDFGTEASYYIDIIMSRVS